MSGGGQGICPAPFTSALVMRRDLCALGHRLRHPVRELSDHEHVALDEILHRRDRIQAGVKFTPFLARIPPDIVELHIG